ncbi:hypothetical protein P691DRAFT_779311 [Macrolepiota fuliginosa MF-IS2]|uniref:F-box domain-containing protein n=1 Tax=Macrolepiota fuliginosa MF-IS2 TaxID=1400762 RepID=A0A9P5X2V2_9AGAR|nr:hypothetical protein P691DRAFT_779311 [Macrolepiota fuliginosa MF-IS2]
MASTSNKWYTEQFMEHYTKNFSKIHQRGRPYSKASALGSLEDELKAHEALELDAAGDAGADNEIDNMAESIAQLPAADFDCVPPTLIAKSPTDTALRIALSCDHSRPPICQCLPTHSHASPKRCLSLWPTSKAYLISLPPEILDEILSYLGVESLLSLRQTCRALRKATSSRHIWLHLAKTFLSRSNTSRLEEPLDSYTGKELEDWTLRRCRVQSAWSSPNLRFTRRTMQGLISPPTLLPGGRWLLSIHEGGRLLATDLDARVLESKTLVEVGEFIEGSSISDFPGAFEVWVDPRAAYLSCRIALFKTGFLSELDGGTTRTRFHIYQMRLEGHGSDAQLVAEPYQVFEGLYPGKIMSAALDDCCVIQSRDCSEYDDFWEDHWPVVHITPCHIPAVLNTMPVTMKIDGMRTITDTYILPNKRFAVSGRGFVRIYAIPTTAETSSNRVAPLQTIRLRLMPTQMVQAIRSPLLVGPHSTTIMYAAERAIVVLQVPHDSAEALRIIELGKHSFQFDFKQYVTFSRTVFVWRNGGPFLHLGITDHDWFSAAHDDRLRDRNLSYRTIKNIRRATLGSCVLCGYDEGIGRLVVFGSDEGEPTEIYDTIC